MPRLNDADMTARLDALIEERYWLGLAVSAHQAILRQLGRTIDNPPEVLAPLVAETRARLVAVQQEIRELRRGAWIDCAYQASYRDRVGQIARREGGEW